MGWMSCPETRALLLMVELKFREIFQSRLALYVLKGVTEVHWVGFPHGIGILFHGSVRFFVEVLL